VESNECGSYARRVVDWCPSGLGTFEGDASVGCPPLLPVYEGIGVTEEIAIVKVACFRYMAIKLADRESPLRLGGTEVDSHADFLRREFEGRERNDAEMLDLEACAPGVDVLETMAM